MREYHRHNDQRVLQPLMGAQHPEQELQRPFRRVNHLRTGRLTPTSCSPIRRDDDGGAGRVEYRDIVPAVADIVETGVAVVFLQRVSFFGSLQIGIGA